MLVQVIHILQHTLLSTNHHVINRAQVLRVLRQTDTTGVGHNRHAELAREQQNGQNFVDTADTAGVSLQNGQGSCLQELLEDNAVLAHFTGGDTDGAVGGVLEGLLDGGVAEDVVGGGGLFDEPGLEFGELLHPGDGFGDGPDLLSHEVLALWVMDGNSGKVGKYLVGINHEDVTLIITNGFTSNSQSPAVFLDVSANLQLEVLVSLLNALLEKDLQLLLTISQPSRAGSVSRYSLALLRLLDAVLLAGLDLLQEGNGLLGCDGISDVAEVNAADELLGSHVRDDAPDRLVQGLGPQIPQSVDDGTKGQVNNTLLGSNPAQLAVGDQVAPGLTPVSGELIEVFTDDEGSEEGNSGADDFVAAADGEGLGM